MFAGQVLPSLPAKKLLTWNVVTKHSAAASTASRYQRLKCPDPDRWRRYRLLGLLHFMSKPETKDGTRLCVFYLQTTATVTGRPGEQPGHADHAEDIIQAEICIWKAKYRRQRTLSTMACKIGSCFCSCPSSPDRPLIAKDMMGKSSLPRTQTIKQVEHSTAHADARGTVHLLISQVQTLSEAFA